MALTQVILASALPIGKAVHLLDLHSESINDGNTAQREYKEQSEWYEGLHVLRPKVRCITRTQQMQNRWS